MDGDDERVFSSLEILERYKRGERDFRGLTIEDRPNEYAFRGANLSDADFSEATAMCVFAGATLERARFDDAYIKTASFDGCDLRHASFARAAIDSATFVRADMSGANFEGAGAYSHVFRADETP
jgi:uncharacterized protein YjbI with pentapeptide repeats